MTNSTTVVACPVCCNHFSHEIDPTNRDAQVFGYGLDFRLVPTDCNLVTEVAVCPECSYAAPPEDFDGRVPGHVKELVRSDAYVSLFKGCPPELLPVRSWRALINILDAKGINPRDLGLTSL